jgi:hypothetical protein
MIEKVGSVRADGWRLLPWEGYCVNKDQEPEGFGVLYERGAKSAAVLQRSRKYTL